MAASPGPRAVTTLQLKKKNSQRGSCKLSFIWGQMRMLAWETASQIPLRNFSKETGEG